MALTAMMRSASLRSVHVLPVEIPGGWRVRVEVEQAVRRRGWRLASGPADADALVICGAPGSEWDELIDRVWGHLPGPRVRVTLANPAEVTGGLDRVVRELGDRDGQSVDAGQRRPDEDAAAFGSDRDTRGTSGMDMGDAPDGHDHHEESHHGDMDMGGDPDMGDIDMGGDPDMDMGDMDMDMAPSGIPLATGADDRDGLEMDELHVPLGPVLRHWPAGLVVRCVLHGDLVTGAEVELLPGSGAADAVDVAAERAAGWCDSAASTLRLAGAERPADRAVRLRDDLLDPTLADRPETATGLARLARDVRSSRVLRWSLGGLGVIATEVPGGPPTGDVHSRLCAQLDHALGALRGDPAPALDADGLRDALPGLMTGIDLAAARLMVASVWPPAVVAREAAGV
ncbi:MAG: hypothetical protein ABIR83_14035 [Nakamurella sp.]